jgi:hypothetical protein
VALAVNWDRKGIYRPVRIYLLTINVCSTLLVGKTGLEQAKKLLISYKQGETKEMTPQLWKAKKIVDSTLHPGTAG